MSLNPELVVARAHPLFLPAGSPTPTYTLRSNPLSKLVAVPDPDARGSTAASKLRVGPELLTKLPTAVWKPLLGPYWVVATGECGLLRCAEQQEQQARRACAKAALVPSPSSPPD